MEEAEQPRAAVNALNASERVLQCFWDLASVEQGPRLQAVQQLVQDVRADQQAAAPTAPAAAAAADSAEGQAASKTQKLEHSLRNCSPVMTYTLRRLAKGVGSGRAASRQGYATALAALLAAPAAPAAGADQLLTFQDGLALLEGSLESTGGGKGGDVRDALLGRIFGLASLVRAGTIRSPTDASLIVTALLGLAAKKTFLREAATAVVLELLLGGPLVGSGEAARKEAGKEDAAATAGANGSAEHAGGRTPGGKKRMRAAAAGADAVSARWLDDDAVRALLKADGGAGSCEALRKFMSSSPSHATPEALLMCVRLWPLMPSDLIAASPLPQNCPAPPLAWAAQPQSVPHSQLAATAARLFSPGYLKQVLPALQSTTACSPRLHLLWSYLLPFMLPGFTPQQRKAPTELPITGEGVGPQLNTEHLSSFWSVVVEEGLFTSSHERQFLGFQLFLVMLPRLPASVMDTVFSRNFSHALANSVSKDTYLHAMGKKVMERVQQFLARSPDVAAKLSVSAALSRLGGMGFQQQAAGKATAGLLKGMDEEGVQAYCQQYMQVFLQASETAEGASASKPRNPKHNRGKGASQQEGEDMEVEEDEAPQNEAAAAAAALDRRRGVAIEQLVAALRFPAATDALRTQVLRFLAVSAFFAPASASETDGKGKEKSKGKDKKGKKASGEEEAVPEEVVAQAAAVAAGAPPLSAATRLLCAQRLVVAALNAPVPSGGGGGAGGVDAKQQGEDGDQPPSKKSKKASKASPQQRGASSPEERDVTRLLGPVTAYVRSIHARHATGAEAGARVVLAGGTLEDEADVALTVLRELEDALQAVGKQSGPGGGRARALLHLTQLLQLHVLGSLGTAAPPLDTSLIYDLRRVAQESVGIQLEELQEEAVEGESEEEESEEEEEEGSPKDAASAPPPPSWSEVLLDLLLSLLSRPSTPLPSAPLRAACEAVWRQSCEGLTLGGMQDLIRVVAASSRRVGEGGVFEDEDQDDQDEEEEEEDHVGSSSDEEDADDDDSEDTLDVEQAAKRASIIKAVGGAQQEKSDDETDEETDEVVDDAEMFRTDDKIASYLRALTDKRKGAKEAAAALSALQFRALSLLEVFARKAPSSPLLLLTLVPLIRALVIADKPGPASDSVLAQRLKGLLLKTICKSKPVYDPAVLPLEETAEPDAKTAGGAASVAVADQVPASLPAVLKRLLHQAGRAESKAVAEAAGAALGMALRSAGSHPGALSIAEGEYTFALTDFLRQKRSRLTRPTVEACGCRLPLLGLARGPLVELLKEAGGAARNGFKQVEAMQLLASLLKAAVQTNPTTIGTTLAATLKPHASALGVVLEAAACGAGLKTPQHADALRAAVMVVEVVGKVAAAGGRKMAEFVGAEHIHGVAKAIATVQGLAFAPAPRVSAQLARLASALAITDTVKGLTPDPALRARLEAARDKRTAATKAAAASSGGGKPGAKGPGAGEGGKGPGEGGLKAGPDGVKKGKGKTGPGKKAGGGKQQAGQGGAPSKGPAGAVGPLKASKEGGPDGGPAAGQAGKAKVVPGAQQANLGAAGGGPGAVGGKGKRSAEGASAQPVGADAGKAAKKSKKE